MDHISSETSGYVTENLPTASAEVRPRRRRRYRALPEGFRLILCPYRMKSYVCKVCGQRFSSRHDYAAHKLSHALEQIAVTSDWEIVSGVIVSKLVLDVGSLWWNCECRIYPVKFGHFLNCPMKCLLTHINIKQW